MTSGRGFGSRTIVRLGMSRGVGLRIARRDGPGLSDQARRNDHPVAARRAHRHHGPLARSVSREGVRTAGAGRQPRRRWRRHRHDDLQERAAGRLHDLERRHRAVQHAVSEEDRRLAMGLHLVCAGLFDADGGGRSGQLAVQDRERNSSNSPRPILASSSTAIPASAARPISRRKRWRTSSDSRSCRFPIAARARPWSGSPAARRISRSA